MASPPARGPIPPFVVVIALAALALALVAAITMLKLNSATARDPALQRQADSLRAELRGALDTAKRANIRARDALRQRDEFRDGLDEWTIRGMRQIGFHDPVRDIKRDLMKHPELIPYPGTLGGTMGFYGEDQIRVLNDHWVLAEFEDGHIGGWMLLGWRHEGTKFYWKRIESYME